MKPKILLLVTSPGWGGAERYVVRLAEACQDAYDVTVAAGRSERSGLFDALPSGVARLELRHLVREISLLEDLRAVRELRTVLERGRFDLVHCNSSKAGLIGALAAAGARPKPKVVYTAHGWGFLERRSPAFRAAVLVSELLASRRRDATIVLSEVERAVALRLRLARPDRLHLIPLGIDPAEIDFLPRDEARARLAGLAGARLGPHVIGTIANSYPAKGLPILFEAFEEVAAVSPDTDLVVLGDGPEMPKLRALREVHPYRDRLHLPGAVRDGARLLKGFDVFALPSLKEGMPWTILEASLAGLPIVATRVGAIPETIDEGAEGLLVPPGSAPALAAALRRLLTDRALLAEITNGAPRIAGRRLAATMLSKTLELYRTLMAPR